MTRFHHHGIIAQEDDRNHPLQSFDFYLREGQRTALDRTGNYTPTQVNLTWSSVRYNRLPCAQFAGNGYLDISKNINAFRGSIGATFRVTNLANNNTIWTNSQDGTSFAFGLFVLSNGQIRVHDGANTVDTSINVALNTWIDAIVTLTDTQVWLRTRNAIAVYPRFAANGYTFLRIGGHSHFAPTFGLVGQIARLWIS